MLRKPFWLLSGAVVARVRRENATGYPMRHWPRGAWRTLRRNYGTVEVRNSDRLQALTCRRP